MKALFFGYQAL